MSSAASVETETLVQRLSTSLESRWTTVNGTTLNIREFSDDEKQVCSRFEFYSDMSECPPEGSVSRIFDHRSLPGTSSTVHEGLAYMIPLEPYANDDSLGEGRHEALCLRQIVNAVLSTWEKEEFDKGNIKEIQHSGFVLVDARPHRTIEMMVVRLALYYFVILENKQTQ
jgi:hypothetical protein